MHLWAGAGDGCAFFITPAPALSVCFVQQKTHSTSPLQEASQKEGVGLLCPLPLSPGDGQTFLSFLCLDFSKAVSKMFNKHLLEGWR